MINQIAAARFRLTLALTVMLSMLSVALPALALADINLDKAGLSPSNGSSLVRNQRGDITAYGATKHLLIYSNHGNVQTVQLAAYYNNAPGGGVIGIYDPKPTDGGLCDIHNPSGFSWSNTFVTVKISNADGVTAASTTNIAGKNICNGRFDSAGGFYGYYTIPNNAGAAVDDGSGLHKILITISLADRNNIWAKQSGTNKDQQFNFKVSSPGGAISNVDTGSSANNSVAGKFEGTTGFVTQYFPFGLACSVGNTNTAAVSVYDADNTSGGSRPLYFYIAHVRRLSTGATQTIPLADSEYAAPGGSYFSQSPPSGRGASTTRVNGALAFVPGDYNDKNGRTTVYIKTMISTSQDPDQGHYALIVGNIDTNGGHGGGNNYIYIGTPGDGIFGAANFDTCPPAQIATNVAVTPPPVGLYTGGPASLTPKIDNVGGNFYGTVNSYNVEYWYSATDSASQTPVNSTQLPSRAGPGSVERGPQFVGPDYNITTLPSLPADTRYLCARTNVVLGPNTQLVSQQIKCSKFQDYQPYMRVYGGDVEAGNGPSETQLCTSATPARISGWNNAAVSNYNGAGGQFGVQAMDVIKGFVSAQGNLNPNPVRGTGLSFANTDGVGGEIYGGKFDAVSSCADYTQNLPAGTVSVTTTPADPVYRTGTAYSNISAGTHKTVYVTGNAYIENNIVYAGGYTLGTMPSFKLVVKGGNIYIGNNVTELDGVYVAQPSGGVGGNIYTCATVSSGSLLPVSSENIYNDCRTQLKVYGSFVAKKVYFLRTFGTIGNAGTDASTGSAGTSNAGEQFIYSPETWLGQTDTVSGSGSKSKWQAITSLPPTISGN